MIDLQEEPVLYKVRSEYSRNIVTLSNVCRAGDSIRCNIINDSVIRRDMIARQLIL
jgi:hypothetical protein